MNAPKKLLLIEDHAEDQEYFISTLRAISKRTICYTATNGKDALSLLMRENIALDYIFTNLRTPLMNGFELLQHIRCIPVYSNVPVILFSDDYTTDQILKAKTLGVIAFYSKARFTILSKILRYHLGISNAEGLPTQAETPFYPGL
jgi:CheY-like chemotaxis protein